MSAMTTLNLSELYLSALHVRQRAHTEDLVPLHRCTITHEISCGTLEPAAPVKCSYGDPEALQV